MAEIFDIIRWWAKPLSLDLALKNNNKQNREICQQ